MVEVQNNIITALITERSELIGRQSKPAGNSSGAPDSTSDPPRFESQGPSSEDWGEWLGWDIPSEEVGSGPPALAEERTREPAKQDTKDGGEARTSRTWSVASSDTVPTRARRPAQQEEELSSGEEEQFGCTQHGGWLEIVAADAEDRETAYLIDLIDISESGSLQRARKHQAQCFPGQCNKCIPNWLTSGWSPRLFCPKCSDNGNKDELLAEVATGTNETPNVNRKPMLVRAMGFRNTANIMARNKDWSESIKHYLKGISSLKEPDGPQLVQMDNAAINSIRVALLDSMARCLLSVGQWGSCILVTMDSIEIDGGNTAALFLRSIAYELEHQFEKALQDVIQVQKLGGGSYTREEIRERIDTLRQKANDQDLEAADLSHMTDDAGAEARLNLSTGAAMGDAGAASGAHRDEEMHRDAAFYTQLDAEVEEVTLERSWKRAEHELEWQEGEDEYRQELLLPDQDAHLLAEPFTDSEDGSSDFGVVLRMSAFANAGRCQGMHTAGSTDSPNATAAPLAKQAIPTTSSGDSNGPPRRARKGDKGPAEKRKSADAEDDTGVHTSRRPIIAKKSLGRTSHFGLSDPSSYPTEAIATSSDTRSNFASRVAVSDLRDTGDVDHLKRRVHSGSSFGAQAAA